VESANVKVHNIFHCKRTLHVAKIVIQNSCNTVYLRNRVCFRYVIVNNQYTGDNKDDDDDNNNNNNNNEHSPLSKSTYQVQYQYVYMSLYL